MTHFVATTERLTVEGLVQLFRNNVWKLYGLPESVVFHRGSQFVVELNKMLGIETKLLTSFHLQIDSQTEKMNQELKQYL